MENIHILTLDLYRLLLLGLNVQLDGLDTGINLHLRQPMLQQPHSKDSYTPRKYQAASVE